MSEPTLTNKTNLITWLLRASQAIYIAVEKSAADDISDGLVKAVKRIVELEAERDKLQAGCKQAIAKLSAMHDVPPEHDSEPVPFHKGWELAVRAAFAALSPKE